MYVWLLECGEEVYRQSAEIRACAASTWTSWGCDIDVYIVAIVDLLDRGHCSVDS